MEVIPTTFDRIGVGKLFLWKKEGSTELVLMEKQGEMTAFMYGRAEKPHFNQISFRMIPGSKMRFEPNQSVVRIVT